MLAKIKTADAIDSESNAKPTPEELVARARALFPLLRENNAEAERLRKVPEAVIAACREAGLFKIAQPAAYGGYEYEPMVVFNVAMELSRASAAIGWVVSLIMIHSWEIGHLDPRIAEDIWGEDPDALISSSYAPFGKAEAVPGGYLVSGRWAWSSGSDHCQWAVVGTHHPNPDAPIAFDAKVMIIPRRDYEVDQNSWHMAGMQGSGSKDVVVSNAFVPDYRHHNVTDGYFKDSRPGKDAFTAKTYQYPFGTVFGWALASVLIGAAQGALDLYVEAMRSKRHVFTGQEAKQEPFNQQRIGEAAAMIHAARAVMKSDFAEMSATIDEDGMVAKDRRALYKLNLAFHARAASQAVVKMINAAGGSSFALDNELQRFFRDTQAMRNHAYLNFDKGAASYGWFLLTGIVMDFAS